MTLNTADDALEIFHINNWEYSVAFNTDRLFLNFEWAFPRLPR